MLRIISPKWAKILLGGGRIKVLINPNLARTSQMTSTAMGDRILYMGLLLSSLEACVQPPGDFLCHLRELRAAAIARARGLNLEDFKNAGGTRSKNHYPVRKY